MTGCTKNGVKHGGSSQLNDVKCVGKWTIAIYSTSHQVFLHNGSKPSGTSTWLLIRISPVDLNRSPSLLPPHDPWRMTPPARQEPGFFCGPRVASLTHLTKSTTLPSPENIGVNQCPIFSKHIPTICGVWFCPHGIPITIWLHGHGKLPLLTGKSSKNIYKWAISHGYVK